MIIPPRTYLYIYRERERSAGPPGATRLWRVMHSWLSSCLEVYSLMSDVLKSACKLFDSWIVGPTEQHFTTPWPCYLSPGIPAICSKCCICCIYDIFAAYAAPVQANATPVQPNTTPVPLNVTPVHPNKAPVQPNTTLYSPARPVCSLMQTPS